MSQPLEAIETLPLTDPETPVVIVGNGPAGIRVAEELMARMPETPLVIYGDEQYEPYNRVRLSSWLAGDLGWQEIAQPLKRPFGGKIDERLGCRVVAIDVEQQTVTDAKGTVQPYSSLVLATGSAPFVPNIPGVHLPGVFTFRDLSDTNRLIARRASSHHTVVLGGGLLGLEAARGMLRNGTRVTVIDHADRLLAMQLDEAASNRLIKDVIALGIEVVLDDAVTDVLGTERVRGVRLRSGDVLACDTLVLATGIRPNIELAKQAKLHFGRGIQVDDQMHTSDANILAVGECCEHRGEVYGLVAPGLEQANVAAASISGTGGTYTGSIAASRLKVVGTQVFSMGPMGANAVRNYGRTHVYKDNAKGIYRKILVHRNRLAGAIGIGEWDETVRLQTAIGTGQLVWPWQIMRFLRTGLLWPLEDTQGIAAWPGSAVVCQCTGVTRGAITEAVALGACCTEDVTKATGASSVCGSCKPLVQDLLGSGAERQPVAFFGTLLTLTLLALVATVSLIAMPAIPYASSVQAAWQPDILWRDGLIKQITGFSILGLFTLGLLVSLRKRVKGLAKAGQFDHWRLAHLGLGILAIVALLAHTGMRAGHGLNFVLMVSFSAMLLLGGITSLVIAFEHRIGGALATRLRRQSGLIHILLFWPIPMLLGWHVFKGYWF